VQHPKRSQYKYAKKPYRIGNWPEYEAGLRRRGDLTLWFSEEAIQGWRDSGRRKPGGQKLYTNLAIETALTVRAVYHLRLRQAEGFLRSVAVGLGLDLPIPDHTTLSRRRKALGKVALGPMHGTGPLHILIDSTGLRVHVGHRCTPPKNRAWRKLHLAVDRDSGEILAAELSSRKAHDSTRVPKLLKPLDRRMASACADGAYDTDAVYEALRKQGGGGRVRILVPPPRNARVRPHAPPERNRNVRALARLGRRAWYRVSGASARARVENVFYRYKAALGREMRARTLAGQRVEARIGAKILNRMAQLGMPESHLVA
jgi:IS5 family transposase